MKNDQPNRMAQPRTRVGRPSNAEIEARPPPVETEAVAHPSESPSRRMVMTLMKCCGRWEIPRKLEDKPDHAYVQCPGCGKRSKLYPLRQVVC